MNFTELTMSYTCVENAVKAEIKIIFKVEIEDEEDEEIEERMYMIIAIFEFFKNSEFFWKFLLKFNEFLSFFWSFSILLQISMLLIILFQKFSIIFSLSFHSLDFFTFIIYKQSSNQCLLLQIQLIILELNSLCSLTSSSSSISFLNRLANLLCQITNIKKFEINILFM